jgi:membrane associated rhomboid family serine protease
MAKTADREALLEDGKVATTTLGIMCTSIMIQSVCQYHPHLIDLLSFNPSYGVFSLLGVFTSMFAHASWDHLIGNYLFGLPFMLYLESKLGPRKMLEYCVLCGFFAATIFVVLSGPIQCIGSSGAVFGCMAGACLAYGNTFKEHFWAMVFMLLLLIPQMLMGPYSAMTGTAHYAHVGGVVGALILSSRYYRGTTNL